MTAFISNISIANPHNKISQKDIAGFMNRAHKFRNGEKVRLDALYRASGIKYRYSVLDDFSKDQGDYTFFPNNKKMEPFPSTQNRMDVYQKEAINLADSAADKCLSGSDFHAKDITHLITVSCTGFYAPGIDIEIIQKLGLNYNVHRTGINYMGCYAAISAMKSATSIVNSDPQAKVLIICVELCTIHFQKRATEDFMLANALFGDGAAAMILSSEPSSTKRPSVSIRDFQCKVYPEGKNDMAWSIGDLGFEMKLSTYVPEIIKSDIKNLVNQFIQSHKIDPELLKYYAIHPGGKKILEVIEEELEISRDENSFAHQVLNEFGNMSSPTVLFVLKMILDQLSSADQGKHILGLAFGPGLTVESMLLDIHTH